MVGIVTQDAPSPWLEDLKKNGYAVVKGAAPSAHADKYVDSAVKWLEGFKGLGFKHEDPKTWTTQNLPIHYHTGLFTGYSCSHEQWVWDARLEPGVSKAFEEIWGTDELIVSFDAINISLPMGPGKREDVKAWAPWPHMDQNPKKPQFELIQGFLACSKSEQQDGGLMLLKGTHNLVEKFFAETGGIKPEQDSGDRNYYIYTEKDMEWFRSQPEVEEIKVDAEPGDLVLWDSRTVHWNRAPTGDRTRVVIYICMAPRSKMSPEALAKKAEVFEKRLATTHWPHLNILPQEEYGPPQRDGKQCPHDRSTCVEEPIVTDRLLQLIGAKPY